ncbi:hypothetical protein B296_00020270 [Ensete ventricosum]|uniref:Uncharacterized protein n=1 Tax=Ensete ventricosum TaxID=4639 RepID=A0A427A801_ENSVE|nr:hypothetical protein B296_00020270 [Ensete ventricosum]
MQSGAIGMIDPLVHLFSLVSLNPKSSLYGRSLVSCWWLEAERFACRWSRIARRLPGRTDNEIKNYWRTHTRRKAQERNRSSCPSPSSSSVDPGIEKPGGGSVAGGSSLISGLGVTVEVAKGYTMDQIWNEIAASESASGLSFEEEQDCCPPMPCSMVIDVLVLHRGALLFAVDGSLPRRGTEYTVGSGPCVLARLRSSRRRGSEAALGGGSSWVRLGRSYLRSLPSLSLPCRCTSPRPPWSLQRGARRASCNWGVSTLPTLPVLASRGLGDDPTEQELGKWTGRVLYLGVDPSEQGLG